MNLKLKNTPEQIELIKAMGSRNQLVSREAQEAFAAFLGPVIQKVLMNAGSAGAIFSDAEYDEDDSPSYPLDLYYNEGAGYVSVWSQHMAGGLPSSEVTGVSELKISTYRLDSAVSFNKRYARRSRLDVISKAVERMANEVLIKQERNAWAVVLKALAEGSTNESSFASGVHSSSANKHVWHTGAAKNFSLHQLNLLLRKHKRMNEGFAGMTPIAPYSSGLTDLFVSPEIMSDIRAFAYNPLTNNVTDPTAAGGQHLTNNVRDGIWSSGGMSEIFGITINELIELGVNKKYNDLFDTMAGALQYSDLDGVATNLTFSATDELIVGIDRSRGAFIRPVARNADSGGTFVSLPDDQWNLNRLDKAGFYGSMEEGRVCLDARAIAGLVLDAA
jgi:hypothetical protein